MNQQRDRDEWLMAQVALGNRDHLEPLIRRYAGPLLTFIRRMIGDQHRSEELFQEVFLAVWTKRGQYQFPRPFKSWLYAIAANRCRAEYRLPVGPGPLPLDDDSPLTPAAANPSPVDTAISTETVTLIESAVARLPHQQRTVVALRLWGDLSYYEIAETLGRSAATVRSNMHHGLAALRKYLEPRLK